MNGLDKITDKIISDAKEKAKAFEDEANAKIEEMKSNTMEEISRIEQIYISRAEKMSEEINVRAVSSAKMAHRNTILQKKAEMISLAFDETTKKILSYQAPKYISFMSDALYFAISERKKEKEEILRLYGEEEAEMNVTYEIVFNKKDNESTSAKKIFDIVSKKIKGVKLALSDKYADIDGGFILKCGDIEMNFSVTAMVNKARSLCESKVVKQLF